MSELPIEVSFQAAEDSKFVPIFKALLIHGVCKYLTDGGLLPVSVRFEQEHNHNQVGVTVFVNDNFCGTDFTNKNVYMLCPSCGPVQSLLLKNEGYFCSCGKLIVDKQSGES